MSTSLPILAWDLEISLPEAHTPETWELAMELRAQSNERYNIFDDWPFGVTVGAAAAKDYWGYWADLYDGGIWDEETANIFLEELKQAALYIGTRLVGWNSTKFDWPLLGRLTGKWELVRELARKSYDPAFQVLCTNGYPIGQDKVCKAMGLPGKPTSDMGAQAPVLWTMGETARKAVVDYCVGDAKQLATVFLKGEQLKKIMWVTRSGSRSCFPLPHGWLTVEECLKLPEPDVSWQDVPWSRQEGLEWYYDK